MRIGLAKRTGMPNRRTRTFHRSTWRVYAPIQGSIIHRKIIGRFALVVSSGLIWRWEIRHADPNTLIDWGKATSLRKGKADAQARALDILWSALVQLGPTQSQAREMGGIYGPLVRPNRR